MTRAKVDTSKKPMRRRWWVLSLAVSLALVALTSIIVFAVGREAAETITVIYTDGTYSTENKDAGLFSDFTLDGTLTVSDTLILPGDTFGDNVKVKNVTLNKKGDAQLDSETFYFDTPAEEETYSDLWAYSFTGWKIVGTTEKIPGKTVFQPGDVITPDILATYAKDTDSDGTKELQMEAVWGKCWFVQNQYETMVYALNTSAEDKDGNSIMLYGIDTEKSTGLTGASDANTAKNPEQAKATINGLFETIRQDLGATEEEGRNNPTTYDCYSTVVMLAGDLDYYTDNNSVAEHYGHSTLPNENNAVYVSATYKSLGGNNYNYNFKPHKYSSKLYGNFRFDNVNFCLIKPGIFGSQSRSSEFMLYHFGDARDDNSYIEFTARYNQTIAKGITSAIGTFRPNATTYVVVNGGRMSGFHNQYSTAVTTGKQLYWTVGRNAYIENLICGTSSEYADNVINLYHKYCLNVLGGEIKNLYGGSSGANCITMGERRITLLGSDTDQEYNPKITKVCGGATQARMYADVYLTAKNCTNLGYVFGGGRDYTATTYGNIYITLENCKLSENLYGGGEYGNCSKTGETYIQYIEDKSTPEKDVIGEERNISTLLGGVLTSRIGHGGDVVIKLKNTDIKGNIYGSGIGQTQTMTILTSVGVADIWQTEDGVVTKEENIYTDATGDWSKPLDNYPSYNDKTYEVLFYSNRSGTYTDNAPTVMTYRLHNYYASLSLATVQNVKIEIDGSTVGTPGGSRGNIYGGGSIAKVFGNTDITITNSIVYGNVYGGGDGVTAPSQVKIYQPDSADPTHKEYYQAPWYEGTRNADGKTWSIKWHTQKPDRSTKEYALYTWSSDASLLTSETPGIDTERRLIYSPNTEGLGAVIGNAKVSVTDSTVYKNIYGGGNYGAVGGTTEVNVDGTKTTVHGTVFGGGNGDSTKDETAILGAVTGNVTLTVSGGTMQDIYGGCNAADVKGDVTLNISGGTVTGNAFGANNQKGDISGQVTVNVTGGTVTTLFGGGNQADYQGAPHVTLSGDQSIQISTLYGGGNLAAVGTNVTEKTEFELDKDEETKHSDYLGTYVIIDAPNAVIGTLYGGGNQADIGHAGPDGKADANHYKTDEDGHSADDIKACPYTEIKAGTVTSVYGGNNQSGDIYGQYIYLIMRGGKVERRLFGGGHNAASNRTTTNVRIWGGDIGDLRSDQNQDGTVTGAAYGGGHNAVVLSTNLKMYGGEARSLFGGSYAADIVGYDTFLTATTTTTTTTVPARVAVMVDIKGGQITTFLGGNDYGGNVNGDIIINVGDPKDPTHGTPATPHNGDTTMFDQPTGERPHIRNFFGGGNQADYTWGAEWNPQLALRDELKPDESYEGIRIFIHSGEIYQAFGGGVNADITNTMVSVRGGYFHFIYGGGFNGAVINSALVLKGGNVYGTWLEYNQTTIPAGTQGGYVFAGGYNGYVKNPNVSMQGGIIRHSLFGGGNISGVGYSNVVIKGGTIRGSVYGGGYNGDAGFAEDGTPLENGTTYVEITGGQIGQYVDGTDGREYVGNIYGGGYRGTSLSTHIDIVELRFTEISQELVLGGNIFGGGHEANIVGDTHVHFFNGEIDGNVYGGGRDGHVLGECYVQIFDGHFGNHTTGLGGDINGGGLNGTAAATHVLITDKLATIREYLEDADTIIEQFGLQDQDIFVEIHGDVFGGGEGVSATVLGESNVLIDLNYEFTVTEKVNSPNEITSGETKPEIHVIPQYDTDENGNQIELPYSVIEGSVYGGGDLGSVGVGQIDIGNNIASVTTPASSNVTVREGHIVGGVFGGGNGVPDAGVSYNLYMGTVFGTTNVTVKGGYIEGGNSQGNKGGSVYGGGRQSRVYVGGIYTQATTVVINQLLNTVNEDGEIIALGGSVFGGGDRGSENATNATVPTVIGDVSVTIVGKLDGKDPTGATVPGAGIYFFGGGVYGDGNLCLVKGHRTITMKDFTTGIEKNLKTFYSLQRADKVILDNTDIVLLGAIDLVQEEDTTVYSINRVKHLELTNGSTIKLDSIVHYLGNLTSDVLTDRTFIIQGNNGSNHHNEDKGTPTPLAESEIADYISAYNGNTPTTDMPAQDKQNTVAVANGLQLDIIGEDGEYGTVKGLFSLGLLRAVPGEGGGFVYADIESSIGDFICVTKSGYSYSLVQVSPTGEQAQDDLKTAATATTHADGTVKEEDEKGLFVREPGVGYVKATPDNDGNYDLNQIYYTRAAIDDYMNVIDNVGGGSSTSFAYYYWYINGSTIRYTGTIIGYIGSEEELFPADRNLPQHSETLSYVLYNVTGNDELLHAINGEKKKYDLVSDSTAVGQGLTKQQIAIELKLGNQSIGFLAYTDLGWAIQTSSTDVNAQKKLLGYQGKINAAESNTLVNRQIATGDDVVSIILHKSKDVDAELSGMKVNIEIDLIYSAGHEQAGTPYTSGASMLIFDMNLNIVRLVPVQDVFAAVGKVFAGVPILQSIQITGDSAFTADFITKYIPGAYPKTGDKEMRWYLSAGGYTYYMDGLGRYLTVDGDGNVIHLHSALRMAASDESPDESEPNVVHMDENGGYYYFTTETGVNGETGKIYLTEQDVFTSTKHVIPKNTKITMVDYSSGKAEYYYYICTEDETRIDLYDFRIMGTATTIASALTSGTDVPAFIAQYQSKDNSNTRITEHLLFVFDYYDVDWNGQGDLKDSTAESTYASHVRLQHFYGTVKDDGTPKEGADIMDYVKNITDSAGSITGYERFAPAKVDYRVNSVENGIDDANLSVKIEEKPVYYPTEDMGLLVDFGEDVEWVNTLLGEGEFSLKIEMVDQNGTALPLPPGIVFNYEGVSYYPGSGGKYAVVPVEAASQHRILVISPVYGFDTDGPVRFRVSLHSAADGRYYDVRNMNCSNSASCTFTPNRVSAIDATLSSQLLLPGETVTLTIKSYLNNINEEDLIEAIISGKDENGEYFIFCDWKDIFEGDVYPEQIRPSDTKGGGSAAYTFRIKADATPGSYCIRLHMDTGSSERTQYVYFVIGE